MCKLALLIKFFDQIPSWFQLQQLLVANNECPDKCGPKIAAGSSDIYDAIASRVLEGQHPRLVIQCPSSLDSAADLPPQLLAHIIS